MLLKLKTMSATLAFLPVKPTKNKYLGGKTEQTRFILSEMYELKDGTHTLKKSDIPYLEGLKDGGLPELQQLINNIEKYGEVDLFLEY